MVCPEGFPLPHWEEQVNRDVSRGLLGYSVGAQLPLPGLGAGTTAQPWHSFLPRFVLAPGVFPLSPPKSQTELESVGETNPPSLSSRREAVTLRWTCISEAGLRLQGEGELM